MSGAEAAGRDADGGAAGEGPAVLNVAAGTFHAPVVQAGRIDVLNVAPPPADPVEHWLAGITGLLATEVASRLGREEEQRRVRDPLPLRWRTAPDRLRDHWANIRGTPDAGPLDLAERPDDTQRWKDPPFRVIDLTA
ncbi:hypothetical protein [Kitasatospora sp. NPDC088346]|uniref:hypothetical protein n=1 Tax=Kitasatospora sp. NPDC088346 TaxID=3364073 RepID=UPI00380C7A95